MGRLAKGVSMGSLIALVDRLKLSKFTMFIGNYVFSRYKRFFGAT